VLVAVLYVYYGRYWDGGKEVTLAEMEEEFGTYGGYGGEYDDVHQTATGGVDEIGWYTNEINTMNQHSPSHARSTNSMNTHQTNTNNNNNNTNNNNTNSSITGATVTLIPP